MHLQISKNSDDADGLLQVFLAVSAVGYSTSIDFFAYPDELVAFGQSLADFSGKVGNEPAFEHGSTAERASSWIRLQAYPIDSLGHSALQVSTNRNGARHVRAATSFSVPLEVGDLNRLGSELAAWASGPSGEFEFHASDC